MKLFFASDLHGSLPATKETIELFLASGAEHLILLGGYAKPRAKKPDSRRLQPTAGGGAIEPIQ